LALAGKLERPLLLEGPAGVGKTSLAEALALATGGELVRLPCYEGITRSQALYEWDYPRQILALRAQEAGRLDTVLGTEAGHSRLDLYGDAFLLERPLLRALRGRPGEPPPVLLVDEVDRSDEAFEAFLLEVLGEFAVTIPERGQTVRAQVRPWVLLTSNRTRELSDALRRRCLYAFVDYPAPQEEVAVVQARVPQVPQALAQEVVRTVGRLRQLGLEKAPGTAETLDWCRALWALGHTTWSAEAARATLATVVKSEEDLALTLAHWEEVAAP
jgi:MoxR-like ATPase